jgi:poly(A) polymerase
VLSAILPGADARPLAPLVHLESETNTAPNALRRLAALGGEDTPGRLRLSRAEARRLTLLRDGASSTMPPAEIGYRYGATDGMDMLLLRAALLDTPLDPIASDILERGANAKFPVKPADLMPDYTGPALGQKLQELEDRWIASGFTLSREELL